MILRELLSHELFDCGHLVLAEVANFDDAVLFVVLRCQYARAVDNHCNGEESLDGQRLPRVDLFKGDILSPADSSLDLVSRALPPRFEDQARVYLSVAF